MRKITNTLAIAALLMATWFCLPASVQTTIANNAADMSGHIVMVADSATGRTVTNLFTFNRGAAVPFAVNSSSLKVTNLDADKLDGLDGVKYGTVTVTTSATGAQNNFDPSSTIALNYQITYIRVTSASDITITGFPAGFDGQIITLRNNGAGGNILLTYNSVSSTAGNRLLNAITLGNTPVASAGYISYEYNTTDAAWVMIAHEQGQWITPTFSAGDYTGNGTQTWTLQSGDIGVFAYHVSNKTVVITLQLATTSVGGVANTTLQITNTAWGGLTAARVSYNHASFISDNGTLREGSIQIIDGTHVGFILSTGANWAAAANTTNVYGQLTFEVS